MRSTPDLSYIVSLHNRPDYLAVCCYMLKMQTHRNFEVIVTDNTADNAVARQQRDFVHGLKDKRFTYVRTADKIEVSDCYWSAEYGMTLATGNWLCFPCEDCYYPPEWGQRMLTAGVRYGWDLVLCEKLIVGPEPCGADRYFAFEAGSMSFPGYKPSFIVKREYFPEWLNKPTMGACSGVDRTTLQSMVRNPELRWGVARDLFYFHN
jgi:glycosyltransferase involved in cell wall biosynthesis